MGKLAEITVILTNGVKQECNCDDVTITPIGLVCDSGGDKTVVIFYGQVLRDAEHDYISTWLAQTDEVTISGTKLSPNTACPVKIQEIDNQKCSPTSSGQKSRNNASAIAVPIVLVVIFAAVGVLVALAVFIYWRRKQGESYNLFG